MKSVHLYMMVFGLFFQSAAIAQIQSVSLQASGLTCSMCSRAIYKSLKKVPEVAKVKEDIQHSSYHVEFSNPSSVSLENLKKAVQDAGFSVAWMQVKVNFDNVEIASDSSLKLNDFVFYFVDIRKQKLNGEKKLLILDKDYILENDRKKYAGSYESGPVTDGGGKVFHVTLPQS
jgi:copper chaperone CopZ